MCQNLIDMNMSFYDGFVAKNNVLKWITSWNWKGRGEKMDT